ncbi:MAG: methyltransferase [Desulfuromonadaceae bacterium]|nr:methyltransferase [Desulfuromonadaceae bacterium]
MSIDQINADEALPPHARLIQMGTAYWVSKVVYAAAKLGLADHLAAGHRSAAELVGTTCTEVSSLHRLMRSLASLGILTEGDSQRFGLTVMGEALRTGALGSARSTVLTLGSPWCVGAFEQIMHSLETGGAGFEKAMGMTIFDYLGQSPEDAALFSDTMVGFHGAEPLAVVAAYDFTGFANVVDVGGATGNMLAAILSRHTGLRGVLFDMPHVVGAAHALLKERNVEERVSIETGDFFNLVPSGGDVYLLSHIIHDWNDEQCLIILGNCRKAMKPSSRLLIVEMVLPNGDIPHPGKVTDIVMLVLSGGRERTEAEYAALLNMAGFHLVRVVPTESAVSVVEAVLV